MRCFQLVVTMQSLLGFNCSCVLSLCASSLRRHPHYIFLILFSFFPLKYISILPFLLSLGRCEHSRQACSHPCGHIGAGISRSRTNWHQSPLDGKEDLDVSLFPQMETFCGSLKNKLCLLFLSEWLWMVCCSERVLLCPLTSCSQGVRQDGLNSSIWKQICD